MSGNKLQIALVAGLVVSAGMALQAAMPRLASAAGLLYLRAQYKLATGDTDSALDLLQQTVILRQNTPAGAAEARPQAPSACPYQSQPKRITARRVESNPRLIPVRQLRRSFLRNIDQKKLLAHVQARQAEREMQLQVTMAKLEAQLSHVPGTASVSVSALGVPALRGALP